MSGLTEALRKAGIKTTAPSTPRGPVWSGPCSNEANGGVTQSLINKWLTCRERFRLYAIEGLQPADRFNHRLEYGSMWHVCEEALAKKGSWKPSLDLYCRKLCERYRTDQSVIEHWWNVCSTQFPVYIEYWAKHADVTERTPLLQEQTFDVPYTLPSGRVVRLRGRWDSVDLIGKGRDAGVFLKENKTKSDINEQQIRRQLSFDLQTMLYLVALEGWKEKSGGYEKSRCGLKDGPPIRGVIYNVVRRPLSGGKYSIVQHKVTKTNKTGETKVDYYNRLGGLIKDDPQYFFTRWRIDVLPSDIERFKRECLNPILEAMCDWYAQVSGGEVWPEIATGTHYRMPYGTYSSITEGATGELDEYLSSGSEAGLQRVDTLFGELA